MVGSGGLWSESVELAGELRVWEECRREQLYQITREEERGNTKDVG